MKNARIDQNGVVWFDGGMCSRSAYEQVTGKDSEALPLWDSHNQNVVDVDDEWGASVSDCRNSKRHDWFGGDSRSCRKCRAMRNPAAKPLPVAVKKRFKTDSNDPRSFSERQA